MIKRYYRRFCRWQQAEPHYVNRHEDSVLHCYNCGTEFADNFCPRCGQRAEVGRVGWNSIKESVAILWGMDSRSLIYTLIQLMGRPGYLVREYISGHRQVSFPPVKMLVIVSLFAVIFESVFHVETEIVGIKFNIPEMDNIVKWFNENKSWGTLLFQIFYVLPTWAVFRYAPAYPRHTLPEGFFLQVFLSTLSLILSFLDYLHLETAENVIAAIYMLITYHQLFGYNWWGTLWRCAVTSVIGLLTMLPFILIALWFGDSDTVMKAGPTILAAAVVLMAVMLYVTHLINKRTVHKDRNRNLAVV